MKSAEQAILEVHWILVDLGLAYAIIGGTAIQVWGEPRFTQDLDLTVGEFSGLLETDDLINRFEQAWRKYGPTE